MSRRQEPLLESPRTERCPMHSGIEPKTVRTIRVLGKGRAAQAVLVEAEMPDGSRIRCVEKVFNPGWLTRLIYRLSFQAPFPYQSNRDAILACFYRRRVAAAILDASEMQVKVARPLYVRFDREKKSWVLAAEWIDGRGIRPAPSDPRRIRRRFGATEDTHRPVDGAPEIDVLIQLMGQLEETFSTCGLIGSGWQVAPRAMVSTANLLKEHDHYTIIDLESGIPAVLVPKYLFRGARRGELPPFDELDAEGLRTWIVRHQDLLRWRIGLERFTQLRNDAEQLIEHTTRWKASEPAIWRRPWQRIRPQAMEAYQRECIRRWQQDETIDSTTATSLLGQRWKARLIWYAGLLPGVAGRMFSRMIGNRDFRRRMKQCFRDPNYRNVKLNQLLRRREAAWIESGRIHPETRLSPYSYAPHQTLASVTPAPIHRFLVDRRHRVRQCRHISLLLFNARYQSWYGRNWIESSIESWRQSSRITDQQAADLRSELQGREVRAYVRGLGAHVALKLLTPILGPMKYGGFAAFIASGNLWFLLPLFIMPTARTAVTLASWWSTRDERIAHSEAFFAGLLPVVGSIAFPLQMFSNRSELSTFLIRDASSRLGRRLPIYGGPDSRTEIAMIRSTDVLIEGLELLTTLSRAMPWSRRSAMNPSTSPTSDCRIYPLPHQRLAARRGEPTCMPSTRQGQRIGDEPRPLKIRPVQSHDESDSGRSSAA